LVEILSAMLQILHISERVLSETKERTKTLRMDYSGRKIEEDRVFLSTKLTRRRRQIEKVAAEKSERA